MMLAAQAADDGAEMGPGRGPAPSRHQLTGRRSRADAAEVDLVVGRERAVCLAWPGPRHRGAAPQGNAALVVADEWTHPAPRRHAVLRRIEALLRHARRRPGD